MAKLTKKEQQQYDKCLGQCIGCMLKGNCGLQIKIRELRILSDAERLHIAVDLLDKAGLNEYLAECERREKDGG